MEKRFTVLRIIASLYKIIAWVVLALGVLGAVAAVVFPAVLTSLAEEQFGALMLGSVMGGVLAAIAVLIVAVVHFLVFYAVGELLYLALAVEENTRETAYYLRGESTLVPPAATS